MGPQATDALPHYARIDDEKASEREQMRAKAQARQRVLEEERKTMLEAQQKKREECKHLRKLEVDRCRPLLGRPVRTGECTNNCTHNADFCTYRHVELRELPPHC